MLKLPYQIVQNLEASRKVLERATKQALDSMSKQEAKGDGGDVFCVFNEALVSLGVVLDHYIEPERMLTQPVGLRWAEKIKRIPITLGKTEK